MDSIMVRWVGLGCLGSALLFGGCAGKKQSIGELRCEGEGVVCKRPEVLTLSPARGLDEGDELDGGGDLDGGSHSSGNTMRQLPELDVDAMWTVDLPCPNDKCSLRGTYAITHPDGALTVARVIQAPNEPLKNDARRVYGGVWLGHFDADGKMLWEDDSLLESSEHQYETSMETAHSAVLSPALGDYEAALALDHDGQALLGVLRTRALMDKNGNYSREMKTEVFRVSEAGQVKQLFRIDDLSELSAIAAVDGDVLLLGNGDPLQRKLNAELARYTPNGRLVWRQTALHEGAKGFFEESLFTLDMPMVIEAKGRAVLATLARPTISDPTVYPLYDAVQVAPDGNIRWVAGLYSTPSAETQHAPSSPRLVRDTLGRYVLAQGAYQVTRFEERDATGQETPTDKNRSPILAERTRDEFWDPMVMGLACDASDRVLVVTQSGTKAERHLLIDRISEDFGKRETFVLPQRLVLSSDIPDPDFVDPYEIVSNTGGIAVGPGQTVFVWTNRALARIALP